MSVAEILAPFVGEYSPVLSPVYSAAGELLGNSVAPGFAGVDWSYILGFLFLIVCVYCVFRVIGALLKEV